MLGLPEFDGNFEGRDREHAAPLHSRSGRGPRRLISPRRHPAQVSDPLILAIDAAGSGCGVAVGAGDRLLAVKHTAIMHGQAEVLLPMVDEVVRDAGLKPSAFDLVAVTTGPGSFTGIRVGISAARGIALAGELSLVGISSFDAVAELVPEAASAGGCLVVALESRRADLYVQLFDAAKRRLDEPAARAPETLAPSLARFVGRSIVIAGDAAERAAAALAKSFAARVVAVPTPALGALRSALRQWRNGEAIGDVRPVYLRSPGVTLAGGRPHSGS